MTIFRRILCAVGWHDYAKPVIYVVETESMSHISIACPPRIVSVQACCQCLRCPHHMDGMTMRVKP